MHKPFVDPDATLGLLGRDFVLDVLSLLRELALEASRVPLDYNIDSLNG